MIEWFLILAAFAFMCHRMVQWFEGASCLFCGTRTGDHDEHCPWRRVG